jgi:hypothetical protein
MQPVAKNWVHGKVILESLGQEPVTALIYSNREHRAVTSDPSVQKMIELAI